jgi:hypothetical protein
MNGFGKRQIVFDNVVFSGTQVYEAIESIIIKGNCTFDSTASITFRAPYVKAESGVRIPPSNRLVSGYPSVLGTCYKDTLRFPSIQEIQVFCSNSFKYKPDIVSKNERSQQNLEVKVPKQPFNFQIYSPITPSEVSISLYPNPTTGVFTLQVGGGDGAAGARAVVWNALGQRVVPGVAVPESGRLELDLRTEAAGVYLVQVVGSTGAVLGSTRVAVQR